jgi:lipopolysaccharide export system permease protein
VHKKLLQNKIRPKKRKYILYDYTKRTVGETNDVIVKPQKRGCFNFDLEDLAPVVYIAETLSLGKLNAFIKKEKQEVPYYKCVFGGVV